MNCEDLNEALVDLVDGRLDGAAQRSVERHLEGCGNCRALVEDLRSIRAAAFMLDRREPKAETWSKVRTAIAAEPAPRGRLLDMGRGRNGGSVNWPVWLGAAAALILATVIGLLPLMNRAEAPHDDTAQDAATPAAEITVESVTAEFEAAERHYQKAIEDLQTIANKDTGELGGAAKEPDGHRPGDHREPRGPALAAVERQRPERIVRGAALEGRGAAADRRID